MCLSFSRSVGSNKKPKEVDKGKYTQHVVSYKVLKEIFI